MLHAKIKDSGGLSDESVKKHFFKGLASLGERQRVLLILPSSPFLTEQALWCFEYYQESLKTILIEDDSLSTLFDSLDSSLFVTHNPNAELVTLGTVEASVVEKFSFGRLSFNWKAQVNSLIASGGFDLILTLGVVAPDEIAGFSSYTETLFLGSGGVEERHKAHYLSGVCGLENSIGKGSSPVNTLLEYAYTNFATQLPIVFALNVVGKTKESEITTIALFMGDDRQCFEEALLLSTKVDITLFDAPLNKVVTFVKSNSLYEANKALYRLKLALAPQGELLIIAPNVEKFSEDEHVDQLIRKYGYRGREALLQAVAENDDLKENLSVATHLIHSSPENLSTITYATKKEFQKEIEKVGYHYCDLTEAEEKYLVNGDKEGVIKEKNGEQYYYIPHPCFGLWADKKFFKGS